MGVELIAKYFPELTAAFWRHAGSRVRGKARWQAIRRLTNHSIIMGVELIAKYFPELTAAFCASRRKPCAQDRGLAGYPASHQAPHHHGR